MLYIDPSITAQGAPLALQAGQKPVCTFAVVNQGGASVNYSVSGVLTLNGSPLQTMQPSPASGTLAAGTTRNVTLVGSAVAVSETGGSAELLLTLVDQTGGVSEQYTLADAYTLPRGTTLAITSVVLGAQ